MFSLIFEARLGGLVFPPKFRVCISEYVQGQQLTGEMRLCT